MYNEIPKSATMSNSFQVGDIVKLNSTNIPIINFLFKNDLFIIKEVLVDKKSLSLN